MLHEYELHRFTRRCAETDRRLEPGESYVSMLLEGVRGMARRDVAAEAWSGPPEDCIGWWRSRVPRPGAKPATAPNEVLIGLLERWADDPEYAELRYVLALLLVRRRVLRIRSDAFLDAIDRRDPQSVDVLRVDCTLADASFEIAVALPEADRLGAIEQQLAELLHTDGGPQSEASAA